MEKYLVVILLKNGEIVMEIIIKLNKEILLHFILMNIK
jgi:hypothetical protein